MELKTEILIIGGGASGMAAAVAAAEMGAEVTVAEANAAVGETAFSREAFLVWTARYSARSLFLRTEIRFQGLYELFPLED